MVQGWHPSNEKIAVAVENYHLNLLLSIKLGVYVCACLLPITFLLRNINWEPKILSDLTKIKRNSAESIFFIFSNLVNREWWLLCSSKVRFLCIFVFRKMMCLSIKTVPVHAENLSIRTFFLLYVGFKKLSLNSFQHFLQV